MGIPVKDKAPFDGLEGELELSTIAFALYLKRSEVIDNMVVKGGPSDLTSDFLLWY